MNGLLSVVIITWNAGRDVKACLDSVLEATAGLPAEIIVVDNGSTDTTGAIVRSHDTQVTIIWLDNMA